MATIRELWIPSPHYSTSRGAVLKGAFHTTEGAQKIRDLGSWFQNPAAGCSSHHGSDNYERGLFGAYVYENYCAWTQGNMNGVCVSLEQCTPSGASSNWSRDTWLSKTILLDNAAEWMHYIAEKYGLPYKSLLGGEAQDTWTKGFTEHVEFGSKGSGHHDCGLFPMDVVLDKARSWGSGSSSVPTPDSGDFMSASVATYEGKQYFAYVAPNGNVCVNGGTVDKNSNAKSGAGITIDPDTGKKTVVFTNQGGTVCVYEQQPGSSSWQWASKGWLAQ
jgi:hypothetical protein